MSELFVNRRVAASKQLSNKVHEGTIGIIVEYKGKTNKVGIEWENSISGYYNWSDFVILQP